MGVAEGHRDGCIVIADDHPVFRAGLRGIVARLYPKAALFEAGTFPELLAIAGRERPDTIVLDLLFPGLDPQSAIASLRQSFAKTSIIVISMLDGDDVIHKVLSQGADGYINKAAPPDELSAALAAIRAGEFVVVKAPTLRSVNVIGADGDCPLTPRQSEVLELLAEGRSNKDIARALDISPFTVRIHVSAVLRSLGVASRGAAVAKAKSLKPHF